MANPSPSGDGLKSSQKFSGLKSSSFYGNSAKNASFNSRTKPMTSPRTKPLTSPRTNRINASSASNSLRTKLALDSASPLLPKKSNRGLLSALRSPDGNISNKGNGNNNNNGYNNSPSPTSSKPTDLSLTPMPSFPVAQYDIGFPNFGNYPISNNLYWQLLCQLFLHRIVIFRCAG